MDENLQNQGQTEIEGGENSEGLTLTSEDEKKNTEGNEDDKKNENNDEVAPDTYDYSNVELPEGLQLDKELTDEFSNVAKEFNLSQSKADKFMTVGVKLAQKLQDKFENAFKEAKENQIKSYSTLLNTDEEIGGASLKQSLNDANIAYEAFVSQEAAEILAETGLNKHPAIVKVFMKIGKELKNDSILKTGNSQKERTADDWYPNM